MPRPSTAEYDQRLGARIRAARLAAHKSQSVLAAALGISFQQIQKYERGHDRIAVATLDLIAKALGRPVMDFLDDVEAPAPAAEAA